MAENKDVNDEVDLAYQGDPEAQYKLAIMFLKGIDIFSRNSNQNLTVCPEKIALIRRVATQSNAKDFVIMLRKYERAIFWLEEAVAQNYAPARCDLATFYALDPTLGHCEDALSLYHQAAKQNDPLAVYNRWTPGQLGEKKFQKNFLPSYDKPKPTAQSARPQEASYARPKRKLPRSSP